MSNATTDPYALERRVAIHAVERASRLTASVFDNFIASSDSSSSSTLTKTDASPVTVGDFGAQAVVNRILQTHFPQDPIVGEEDASDLRQDNEKSRFLKEQVCQLARDALKGSAKECPAVKEGSEEKLWSDEDLLEAIDRGNHQGGSKGRMWALDPIDGTKGFLRGGQYAVCLGLIEDGKVVLGVMGCPNLPRDPKDARPSGDKGVDASAGVRKETLGSLYVAVRGQGAFQLPLQITPGFSEKRISMRSTTSLADSTFCESVEKGHSSHSTNARIAELLKITKPSVRMDSQAKYASIARGDGDIYLRLPVGDGSYQEKIWDHAAGSILVEEAGGVVSDLSGAPLDFGQGRTLEKNKGVVAAPKHFHKQVVEAVKKALQDEGRGALLTAKV